MKRTFVVLALAVLSCAGCRAFGPHRGPGCGDACGDACCEPCYVTRAKHAPRPQLGNPCHSNLEQECPGGNGCLFDRYCGHNCGPGYHPGPYDCSACGSPNWGCTGYRHPNGYVDGHQCLCQSYGACPECRQPGPLCPVCGHGYCCACCGPPAPGCPCCPCCGASGDQNYNFTPGPPTAQTAYPYYTLRGPRDYLLNNPPPLGPY
jgi:hypothetical protein